MIKNFADHAANERTYLAWVRTAIALFGIGLIVERIEVVAQATNAAPDPAAISAEIAALCMLLLGVGVLIIATFRFHRGKRRIADDELTHDHSSVLINTLSFAIIALALVMAAYAVQMLL